MFAPYRGRSHTKKQKRLKAKITCEERTNRLARKKLLELFPKGYACWLRYFPSQKASASARMCHGQVPYRRVEEAPRL
jgi:hypothetical protein